MLKFYLSDACIHINTLVLDLGPLGIFKVGQMKKQVIKIPPITKIINNYNQETFKLFNVSCILYHF